MRDEDKTKEQLIEELNTLRISQDQAKSANQAKSQFLVNLSHEFRSPLHSISGFTRILLNRAQTHGLPAEFKQYLKNIQSNGETLLEVINNVLDISKIEADQVEVQEESLNIKHLFQGIYHIKKTEAFAKQLQFAYEFDPEIPEWIRSDRNKLNRILINLTDNAIKFTPEKGAVRLRAKKEKEMILFQIIDEGIGISVDKQKKIFKKFKQVDSSITRQFGGTGLGLAITKHLIDLLGGQIEVESRLGEGSTFSAKIPLLVAVLQEDEWFDFRLHDFVFSPDNVILVVEDNPMNQEMIKALFRELGLTIHLADNGATGIKQTLTLTEQGHPPDLILMDLQMPGMSGIEAIRQIRKKPGCAKIPIVALSAEVFKEQQKKAYQVGVTDYLTKPLNMNQLFLVLKKVLRYDQSPSTQTDKIASLSSLPDDLNQKILEAIAALDKIPIFQFETIVTHVQEITKLCDGSDAAYPEILEKIERAAAVGALEQYQDLIKAALQINNPSS